MLQFNTTILQFDEMGEKTGWTYIEIPADIAQQLKPNNKQSFRVKGRLDKFSIAAVALMPMGDGAFIMPLNAALRKGIGKRKGAMVVVTIEVDNDPLPLNAELMECLADEPDALIFYKSLAPSHQLYYSKWVDSAKTDPTKAKRIAQALNALSKKQPFNIMLREQKANKI